MGKFEQGLYISQKYENEILNRNLYFGRFKDGIKNDEKAYYYLSNHNKLLYGHIEGDDLIKGYIGEVDGKKLDLPFYFNNSKSDDDDQHEPNNKMLNLVVVEMNMFIKLLSENDFFELVHKDAEKCLNTIHRYGTLEELEDKETLEGDIALLSEFNMIVDLLRELFSKN
jgi:hypothetical protein